MAIWNRRDIPQTGFQQPAKPSMHADLARHWFWSGRRYFCVSVRKS